MSVVWLQEKKDGGRKRKQVGGFFFSRSFRVEAFFFFASSPVLGLLLVKKREERPFWSRAAAPARPRWLFSGLFRGMVEGPASTGYRLRDAVLPSGWLGAPARRVVRASPSLAAILTPPAN